MTCLANAIELRNITKRFGQVVANKSISLELHKGEILSLLGENGSGKTTLMNMLSGIYFPDEGQIYIHGQPVTIGSPKDAFAHGIGMIHQHFKLVDIFTATENIILGLEESGRMNLPEASRKVKEICDKYGFDIDPDQKIYDMSVSQKQTVEIVKVLYRGADILILDEPTAGLDPHGRDEILSIMRDIHAGGTTLIMVSHSMTDVSLLCSRILVMNHAHLTLDGTPEAVFSDGEAIRAAGLEPPPCAQLAECLRADGWTDIPTGAYTKDALADAIAASLGAEGRTDVCR